MIPITIQRLLSIASLWLSMGSAQDIAGDQGEAYIIKNAVDFTPRCILPSAIYKSPDSLFDDGTAAIGHSFVVVRYIVTTDGLPVDIHIDSGSSSAVQATHAMQQLKDWKFSQPQCDGKIVAMKMSMRWEFTANPKTCPPDGCTLPWAPTNRAIVGLRLPVQPAAKPVPTSPPLTPEVQIQKLVAERELQTQQLTFHEDMVAASSFAERTDLFCQNDADASVANGRNSFAKDPDVGPMSYVDVENGLQRLMDQGRDIQFRKHILDMIPRGPYGLTIADLRNAYTELTRQRPATREAEAERQTRLTIVSDAITDYDRELNACRVAVIYGHKGSGGFDAPVPPFPLPTDYELRIETRKERERITQIDLELRQLKKN